MKKILKKVAATILAASMVIGMTACGTGGGGSSTQGGTLENAASVAEMVLTTESLVADLPEPPAAPAAAGGDMGSSTLESTVWCGMRL